MNYCKSMFVRPVSHRLTCCSQCIQSVYMVYLGGKQILQHIAISHFDFFLLTASQHVAMWLGTHFVDHTIAELRDPPASVPSAQTKGTHNWQLSNPSDRDTVSDMCHEATFLLHKHKLYLNESRWYILLHHKHSILLLGFKLVQQVALLSIIMVNICD